MIKALTACPLTNFQTMGVTEVHPPFLLKIDPTGVTHPFISYTLLLFCFRGLNKLKVSWHSHGHLHLIITYTVHVKI